MGLRIATDIASLVALQHLRTADAAFKTASERIASGRRINSAADDPTGSFQVARFKSNLASLGQAKTNVQLAQSQIDTADAGLSGIGTSLTRIRGLILEARSDTSKSGVNQIAIDTLLDSVDRVANTTIFGSQLLLNGSSGFVTSSVDSSIAQLSLRSVFFDGSTAARTFSVGITSAASHGTLAIGDFGSSSGALTITGKLGTTTISVGVGTDVSGVINAVRDFTGVFASGGLAFTEGFGSSESVTIAVASGTGFTGTAGTDKGADIAGTVDGVATFGDGLTLTLSSQGISADVTFLEVAAGSSLSFSVRESGNQFQIGALGNGNDQLRFGIDGVTTGQLGRKPITVKGEAVGGLLTSLRGGGANSLAGDVGNALRIVDDAIAQVGRERSFLGSVSANTLRPQGTVISASVTKITAARSLIEDADIAEETIKQSVALNLFNSSKAVIAQSASLTNSILSLLTPRSSFQ